MRTIRFTTVAIAILSGTCLLAAGCGSGTPAGGNTAGTGGDSGAGGNGGTTGTGGDGPGAGRRHGGTTGDGGSTGAAGAASARGGATAPAADGGRRWNDGRRRRRGGRGGSTARRSPAARRRRARGRRGGPAAAAARRARRRGRGHADDLLPRRRRRGHDRKRGESVSTRDLVASAGQGPDGIAVDLAAGHIFWTGMGNPSSDDGFVRRSNLDGSNVVTLVPAGGTYTPKQMRIDPPSGKLYWSDREGMRIQRSNVDGSNVETLVTTGTGATDRMDLSRWCVGMALDTAGGWFYWSQKGGDNAGVGSIRRAHIQMPAGQSPRTAPTSRCCSAGSPSRSTSSSISRRQ